MKAPRFRRGVFFIGNAVSSVGMRYLLIESCYPPIGVHYPLIESRYPPIGVHYP